MPDSVITARSGRRLSDFVLVELKERLLSGGYRAGSRISIEEVKAEFGVSKQPVMDAMRKLESTGIVEIVPQSGCKVANYTLREVEDFYALFGTAEGEIAAAAAKRRTASQLEELDQVWDRVAALETLADPVERSKGYRLRNRELHEMVHRMAHSQIMADLSARMWDLSDFFIHTFGGPAALSDSLAERNEDHDLIRTAIRNRNSDVARIAMQSHIVETVRHFSSV